MTNMQAKSQTAKRHMQMAANHRLQAQCSPNPPATAASRITAAARLSGSHAASQPAAAWQSSSRKRQAAATSPAQCASSGERRQAGSIGIVQ